MENELKPAVVACIQKENGLLLLLNRTYSPKGWGLPGGKIEQDETPMQAIIREVYEETGIDVSNIHIDLRGESQSHNGRHITVFYIRVPNDTEAKISGEHKGIMWMMGDTIGIELSGKTLDFMKTGLLFQP